MRLGSVWGEMCFVCMDVERERAASSNLYFSIGAVLKEGREEKTRRKRRRARAAVGGGGGKVIKLINLMAFVAHQTWRFSPC